MKKISVIALILAAAACLAVFSGCKKDGEDIKAPAGMILASSDQVDYYMFVPETWKVDKSDLYTSAYFSHGDATSISTTAYSLSGEVPSLDDWWNGPEGSENEDKGFFDEMSLVYTDISEVKESKAKIDGIKGKEYSFSAKLAGKEYIFIITAVIKGYNVYYITYTSTPEYNEDHLEERTQVIDAFKFKD